jgi:DMSO/TMAO reductase YedYZ molybdopterin-dependent catalytic subunit
MTTARALLVVGTDPLCAESQLELQDDILTPVSGFFVRNNFPIPPAPVRLTVGGAVARPMALMADDLMQFPRRYLTTTLECAGNGRAFMGPPVPGEPWRLGAVSTAEWHGVSLADVLERAEVNAAAVEILFEGADGFARSLTVKEALHPDTLLADRMNGEQLTPEHGAPLRLLVPGWYGMASVKWLSSITARRTPFRGHFQTERYVIGDRGVREMRVRALILEPADGATVQRGSQMIRGLAWTGTGHILAVEVSDDGGTSWRTATLIDRPREYGWLRWECDWRPGRRGSTTLLARASDSAGNRQPLEPVWNELGYCNNAAVPRQVEVQG